MKTLVLLGGVLTAFGSIAQAGWDNGNAGDPYAAEFIMTGKDIARRLKLAPAGELKKLKLEQLNAALEGTTVRSEEHLPFRDGNEVGAINYPDQHLIKLSRSVWRTYRSAPQTTPRFTFVLHEYLGILKIDDKNYKTSGPLVALLDVTNYSPSRWWNPLNPVNKITLDLEGKSKTCTIDGINLDPSKTEELVTVESKGDCGALYRKVAIHKASATAPPDSGARGTFHHYRITVTDKKGIVLGQSEYEPEWGKCLGPQDASCRLSGKLTAGNVEMIYWYKLEN